MDISGPVALPRCYPWAFKPIHNWRRICGILSVGLRVFLDTVPLCKCFFGWCVWKELSRIKKLVQNDDNEIYRINVSRVRRRVLLLSSSLYSPHRLPLVADWRPLSGGCGNRLYLFKLALSFHAGAGTPTSVRKISTTRPLGFLR